MNIICKVSSFFSKSFVFPLIFLLLGSSGIVIFVISSKTIFAQSVPCHLFTSSQPIPSSAQTTFGAAYNLFSSAKEVLLKAGCSPSGVTLEVGSGAANELVYRYAYIWINNQRQQVPLSGQLSQYPDYVKGPARGSVNATIDQLRENQFYIAFTCTETAGQQKCGCRDTTCAQNYWQIQGIKYEGATGGGSTVGPLPAGGSSGDVSGLPVLANPNASTKARQVYKYLQDSVKGKGVLAGQHNHPNSDWPMQHAEAKSGKKPAIHSWDWFFGNEIQFRDSIVQRATQSWNQGAFVEIAWHAVKPTDPDNAGWDRIHNSRMSDSDYQQLITPGTNMHNLWLQDVDTIAGYLKKLQDNGVVVLWRPYHENSGGWFWWGGNPKFKQLWKNMYERYTNHHKLNNLIWVWSAGEGNFGNWEQFYPGHEYVDVVGVDVYNSSLDQAYAATKRISQGQKVMALTEVGTIPNPNDFQNKWPEWSWFLVWHNWIRSSNSDSHVNSTYNHSWVLTLDEIRRP